VNESTGGRTGDDVGDGIAEWNQIDLAEHADVETNSGPLDQRHDGLHGKAMV